MISISSNMIENESSEKLQKCMLFNGALENSPDASIFLATRAATQDAYNKMIKWHFIFSKLKMKTSWNMIKEIEKAKCHRDQYWSMIQLLAMFPFWPHSDPMEILAVGESTKE